MAWAVGLLCVASAGLCLAGDGVWLDFTGTWSDTANWAGGNVADGVGSKAEFATLFTGDRTVTVDGAALSPTLGEMYIAGIGKSLEVKSSNAGSLTWDHGTSPSTITVGTNSFGTITISAPITIAGNKKLDLYNNYNGDKYLVLSGKISGDNVVIANRGTGSAAAKLSGPNDFTGEVWAVSDKSRFDVGFNGVEEIAGGDPNNVIRVFPNARLTLNRYGHAVVNPLRTIVMEGEGVSGIGVFYNSGEGNEKKHVPAPVTGDGGLQTTANFVLSGKNTFSGPMKLYGGILQIASLDCIGTGKLIVDGNGTTLAIIGTEFDSFGDHLVEFNAGNNGGTFMSILDPNHVFTLDRGLGMSLNSANQPAFGKSGAGEFVFAAPQTFRNVTGRMLSANGGGVTVDYAAGASLYGSSVNNANRIGFNGGVLNLRTSGSGNDFVQYLGDLWLYGDGGKLVLDNREASGSLSVRVGGVVLKSTADNGQTLNVDILGDPSKATLTTTAANDPATGIWGDGRVVFRGADWPCVASGTNLVVAYSGYAALASAGSTDNALVSGGDSVAASKEINTLKIAPSAAGQTLEIDDAATLTLNNNALLFTGAHDYTVQGGRMGGGRTASDFLLHQGGAGTLTLDTDLVGTNGICGFTKAGPGKLALVRPSKLGGLITIADGILEIAIPESLMYTNGTLTQATSTTTSSLVTCTASELPYGFLPGSSVLGKTVTMINGGPGNWQITLNGNANAALTDGSTTFTTRPTLRNNGTLRVTETMTIPNTFIYGGSGATFDIADGKTVSLTGGKSGGVFMLDNTDAAGSGVVRMSGVVEMGSGVYIRRGVYEVDADNISASGCNPLVFGDGTIATFRMRGGKTVLVAELSGTNANAVVETWTSGTTLFGVLNGGVNRFDGVIRNGTGVIRLVKGGGGVLSLNGANTYTGPTDIKGGVLAVNGSLAAASTVTVQKGALGGTGTVNGTVTVKNGGAIAPGSGGVGTLNIGALTFEPGAALDVELGSGGTDRVAVAGDLTLDGVVNVTGLDGFGEGVYTLMTYTGALADNGMEVGTKPDPDLHYSVRASGGVVTLRVGAPASVIVVR